ncbi:receptor-like protein 9DC3 [Beta vulgaris subsp. vulgaris]|uniref:receptor-like protein 9DC3 n=1 Tax=Beta vulgaris subsp. vulgaris TaxID=3555 RepID=UPI00203758F7|nr:receptor-like protein 9DC3 [Beta vulgaris subsp. vulgaris]
MDIGNNFLNGSIPKGLFGLPNIFVIGLNDNHLTGRGFDESTSLFSVSLIGLDLSNNQLTGELPASIGNFSNLQYLSLDGNKFTGSIPPEISKCQALLELDLSSNQFSGEIPNEITGNKSICNLDEISLLDLSNNTLTGEIPHCLGNTSASLEALNLQLNKLNGTIPPNFSNCDSLKFLHLGDNQLEGVVPKSLSKCRSLNFLNLENNKLTGIFPSSLDSLPQLQVLGLRFNGFYGPIASSSPKVKRPFPRLQILDISNNNFGGKLPERYIKHFEAMLNMNESSREGPEYLEVGYSTTSSIVLTYHGMQQNYLNIFITMSVLDMSNNNFVGQIPDVIGRLHSLRHLNLSHNLLTGNIPLSIGKLSLLDGLDLSSNRLSGRIPQELVSLTFVGVFNVSNNLLEGPIPRGKNFDTFSVDSYKGNPKLCGQPLPACGDRYPKVIINDSHNTTEDDRSILSMSEIIMMGFCSGVLVGLAWGYYMFSIGKPFWFIRLANKMELVLLDLFDEYFGRRGRTTRQRKI